MKSSSSSEITIRIAGTVTNALQFDRRAWQVPSEARALEGWVEGAPTQAQRVESLERARRERANWQPDAEAWQQLIQLHDFIGKRIRIQFFDPGTMYMLNDDEWPHPVDADCVGVVTLAEDGHLQPFLIVKRIVEVRAGGCSGLSYLVPRVGFPGSLAPVADFYEVESLSDAP